jgi:hypothetical protein
MFQRNLLSHLQVFGLEERESKFLKDISNYNSKMA